MFGSNNNFRNKSILTSSSSYQSAIDQTSAKGASSEETEECFVKAIQEPLRQAAKIGEADIVVGIPFYNESETISSVIETVGKGIKEFYPEQKCVIVAAGSPAGGKALQVINNLPKSRKVSRIAFLLDNERISGKGWAIRSIMEVTRRLGADLIIVEADLRSKIKNGTVEGLAPDWINLLIEPIRRGEANLVISRFNRHYLEVPVSAHLVYPLLTAIYNCPIHDLVGAQVGISYRQLRTYLQNSNHIWSTDASGYGIDGLLATKAITSGATVCEANLGIKIPGASGKAELVFYQVAKVLFEQIVADREWWVKTGIYGILPVLRPLAVFGAKKAQRPDKVQIIPHQLVFKYKQGFNRFHSLYERIFPGEIYRQLKVVAGTETGQFDFPPELWVRIVYHFLLGIAFRKEFTTSDMMNSFIPIYEGYTASFTLKIQALEAKLKPLFRETAQHLANLEIERQIEELVDEFLRQKSDFLAEWEARDEAIKPSVPKATYLEFIPGVPLVVPLKLITPDGGTVTANAIYESIFHKYQNEFEQFVYERLKVPRGADSQEIAERIQAFMHQVEAEIDKVLLPGDLSTVKGTRNVVEAIFRHFSHEYTFALLPSMASWLLGRYPPYNLLTRLGYDRLKDLFNKYEPSDVLALANWSEGPEYMGQVWDLVKENVRPEHFGPCVLKPLVMSSEDFPSLLEMNESALNKLVGRVIVGNLHKGRGGEFPKLRYLTTIAKNIIEAERFGRVWQMFAEERRDFGETIIYSLQGHWGRNPLSAHNMFENGHQRVLVKRLREITRRLHQEGRDDKAKLVTLLNDVIDSYHLALTLFDGVFVPCSVWTWASYSFNGGRGLPTPLSLHVERDWFSREFLVEYYKASGGDEKVIEEKIVELMEEGLEWVDLAPILLGEVAEAEEVVPKQIAPLEQPHAGSLIRFDGNPILSPVQEHFWESKYVLNPGALNLDGKIFLIYRALGEDNVSRLGLAVSEDGFNFNERLDKPVFEPRDKGEKKGCEDPRLTLLDDRIYMLYTAYDGLVAQIACASIDVNDFRNYRWESWRRHGYIFPGFTDKNGTLFPERFDGKFAMLHRVEPHIWITFSPHLRCPWPRRGHKILAGSSIGMVWDGRKIGTGAPPIKTEYGWLLIFHGVDRAHVYRLGVMLLDLVNPATILYRSPNPILEPSEACEIGEPGSCWVQNVVFTCGAVPRRRDQEILSATDELLVYYGASDTVISVAIARIADIIPEQFRHVKNTLR